IRFEQLLAQKEMSRWTLREATAAVRERSLMAKLLLVGLDHRAVMRADRSVFVKRHQYSNVRQQRFDERDQVHSHMDVVLEVNDLRPERQNEFTHRLVQIGLMKPAVDF